MPGCHSSPPLVQCACDELVMSTRPFNLAHIPKWQSYKMWTGRSMRHPAHAHAVQCERSACAGCGRRQAASQKLQSAADAGAVARVGGVLWEYRSVLIQELCTWSRR
eukprot:jgi/Ulvmu1/6851/UM031_0056.1